MKDIVIEPASPFSFLPADFVPFKDREVCERVRKLSGKELEIREVKEYLHERGIPVRL